MENYPEFPVANLNYAGHQIYIFGMHLSPIPEGEYI
jgi:hypothetical protein